MDTHDAPDAVRKAAEAEIQAAVAEYDAAPAVALARRDERIRKAAKVAGLKQIEVIKLTGYSRETVRQALNPEARAAVRQAAEERRAQQLHHRDGDPRNNDPGDLEVRDEPEA